MGIGFKNFFSSVPPKKINESLLRRYLFMMWRSTHRCEARFALPAALIIVTVSFLFYSSTLNETVVVAGSAPAPTVFAAPSATFAANAATLGAIPDHVTGCDATGDHQEM